MSSDSSIFFMPIAIGLGVALVFFIVLYATTKTSKLSLRGSAIGYSVCVALSVSVMIIPFVGGMIFPFFYIVIFIPFMFFSFVLNKKMMQNTKLRNTMVNFLFKAGVSILIWFIAFFPFSLFGIIEIINIPANSAIKREITQVKSKIAESEIYADLTPFGLGLYKLNEDNKFLWDITKPKEYIGKYDGVDMVYEYSVNSKEDDAWDNTWGNSNVGKDVAYDVILYEDTYIIITPLWEKPGSRYYWGYIYLCKNIDKDSDLFEIGILDPLVVKKLRELPGERIYRKELAEKLGKAY